MPKSDPSMTRPVASEPSVLGSAGTSVVVMAKDVAGADAVKWSIERAISAFSSRVIERRWRLDARTIAAAACAFNADGTAESRHVDEVDFAHSLATRSATVEVSGVCAAAHDTLGMAESAGAPVATATVRSEP